MSYNQITLTNRERKLLNFTRELGWGEVKVRIENGQPVLIYEAIRTLKLDAVATGARGKRTVSQAY